VKENTTKIYSAPSLDDCYKEKQHNIMFTFQRGNTSARQDMNNLFLEWHTASRCYCCGWHFIIAGQKKNNLAQYNEV